MIPRYTRPHMGNIWTEENKLRTWLEIEILACEAQAELGTIPREAAALIRQKAKFDARRVEQIEAERVMQTSRQVARIRVECSDEVFAHR